MSEIICVDDVFTDQQKKVIPNRPVAEKIYTIREVLDIRTPNGQIRKAVWLVEITNPHLTDELTGMTFEPSFDIRRFTTLLQEPLTAAKLSKIKKLVT